MIYCVQLIEVPMLAVRLDLLFTIREFPANMEEFQPVIYIVHSFNSCILLLLVRYVHVPT